MEIINKFKKSEKGSITVMVLTSMLFMLVVITASYLSISNKSVGQSKKISQISKQYQVTEEDMEQEYEKVYENYKNIMFGAKKISYIQSTGAQWIDTGYVPSSETKVIMNFEILRETVEFFFGARTSTSNNSYTFLQYQDGTFRSDYNNSMGKLSDKITTLEGYPKFKVSKDKNITEIENDKEYQINYAQFECDYNMYIFAINNAGKADREAAIKLYGFEIYEDNTQIRNFIPVLDRNNVPCLYDKVEGKFYYNQGEEEFLYGE